MFYWIHVSGGVEITAFGPFESEARMRDFRQMYGDDEQEDGSYRSALPLLPEVGLRDNHETDAWIPVYGNQFELLDGWPIVKP